MSYTYTYTDTQLQDHHDTVESRLPVENRHKGNQNWGIAGADGALTTTPQDFTVADSEFSAGRFVGTSLVGAFVDLGLFNATSGSYYVEYDGDFTSDFYGIKLADNSISQVGCSLSFVGGKTRLTVDMNIAPAHKFPVQSGIKGTPRDISDNESQSTLYNERQALCGQVDVTAERAIGVPEVNDTGTWIYVTARVSSSSTFRPVINAYGVSISGVEAAAGMQALTPSAKIGPGQTYTLSVAGAGTHQLLSFIEWRPL